MDFFTCPLTHHFFLFQVHTIYIYAFDIHFVKALMVLSRYTFDQYLCSLGSNSCNLCCYNTINTISTNQAAQIPHFNADKRAQCSNTKYASVGRSANLINALIGRISAKWQMTYKVIWVGGHVWRSILSLYGASLLNKFTGKQL